ncbi:MAG TPA: hypothetical protein VGL97_04765 [Bryobacteraceae bacterium]
MTRKPLLRLLFFVAAGVAAQAASVTSITFDNISHSDARVLFNSSGSWTTMRIRYAVSPATCTGGSGGFVQSPFGTNGAGSILPAASNGIVLSGLTAATTYQVCVELSPDGGTTWTSGAGASLTTLSLPSPHPALPIAPATFDTSYPNTAGYTTVAVASDCSDLNSKWDAAIDSQLTTDTILTIPAGASCLGVLGAVAGGNAQFGPSHLAPDVTSNHTFAPSNVTAATGTIHVAGHGLSEGQAIIFGTNYSCLPGSDLTAYCRGGAYYVPYSRGPINLGSIYYAHVVDANDIQVYANAPMGSGGTLLTYSNQGSGNSMYFVTWPRPLHNIIIRTSAPDSQLPPPGTRITPAWASKMAVLVDPFTAIGLGKTLLSPLGGDSNMDLMTANTRFVGLELTYQQTGYSATTSDPKPWSALYSTIATASNIIMDRCWVHGLGTPDRVYQAIPGWDGKNVAIIDSYMDNWEYFHSTYSGLTIANTNSHVATIDSGIHNAGSGPITLASQVTATFSGSGTGRAFAYFDMTHSNALTISAPAGISVSCSGGSACASATAGTNNGTCNYSDGWPKDGDGNPTAALIACIDISGGSITAVTQADSRTSRYDTEGCQCLTAGIGPGPWIVQDNYISAVGLPWHHDDSGQQWAIHGDYTYVRNTFTAPLSRMYSLSNPLSNGLTYYHRQLLEWKTGNRIRIYGNIFDGNWVEDNPASVAVTLSSYINTGLTDVDFENNTFRHVAGITQPTGVSSSPLYAIEPPPGNRFLFRNNLGWDINGFTYCVTGEGGCTTGVPGRGWIFQGPGQAEDIVIDHNTFVGNVGSAPVFMTAAGTRVEGVQVTNNFMYLDSYYGVLPQGSQLSPPCNSAGEAGADCAWPGYVWDHNVMIGNGVTQAQIQAAWPGYVSNNYIPSDTSLSSAGWFNYQAPVAQNGNTQHLDFRLKGTYCAGCVGSGFGPANDGADVGANIDALQAAQGKTTLVGAPASSITSSSASVAFVAPDSAGCPVDYSSSDPLVMSSFTRVNDAGGTRTRNIALSGLSSHTTYYYRVNCAVEQPTGEFRTN